MKTFNLEKINRQTRSKQEFGLPRKKGFFRKSMEITSLEASYWWAIYMLLHDKIIIKMYLIENKEVTLFVQLNW